jgi:hypothetical protein
LRDGVRDGFVFNVFRVCFGGILEDAQTTAIIRDDDVADDGLFARDSIFRQYVRENVAGIAEGDDVQRDIGGYAAMRWQGWSLTVTIAGRANDRLPWVWRFIFQKRVRAAATLSRQEEALRVEHEI